MGSDAEFYENKPGIEVEGRDSEDGKSRHLFSETTQNFSRQLRSHAKSMLSDQKSRIVSQLESMALALKQSVGKMREQHNESAARITEIGADGIERFSNRLRRTDPSSIARDLEDFARRRPVVLAGAALAAGFLIGQILSDLKEGTSAKSGAAGSKTTSSLDWHPEGSGDRYYEH